ncbi:MAG: type II toxin-antitoxin system RelE/ParE family toxin [Leptolyngbya sp. SIO4C1]|nr:type II toxin-antitoxin system RelE/ParE family toxin [Leptolyngbya sp. SIO4C1]
MQRLAAFIGPKNPDAARRAVDRILQAVATIADMPAIGTSLPNRPQSREHSACFGKEAYIKTGLNEKVVRYLSRKN